jgi:hypothetical protein
MHVRLHPLRDGIQDEGLDLEAIQTCEGHDLNDWDRDPHLLKPTGRPMTWGQLSTPVRRPRKLGNDDEDHAEMSHPKIFILGCE